MTSFLSSAIYRTPGAQCSLRQDETQAPGAAFAKMYQETSASLRRRGSPCPVASTSDTVSQGSQTSRIRDEGFRTASRRYLRSVRRGFRRGRSLGAAHVTWTRSVSRRLRCSRAPSREDSVRFSTGSTEPGAGPSAHVRPVWRRRRPAAFLERRTDH